MYFPRVPKFVACPIYGCPERVNKPGVIIENFMYWHWKENVTIIQEGAEPLPRCDKCGMHMPSARLIEHIREEI